MSFLYRVGAIWYGFCMDHRLIQQHSQKLILSPQIRQYLKLLQMPVTELEQAIESELSENPMLEEKAAEISNEAFSEKTSAEDEIDIPIPKNTREVRVGETFDNFGDIDESYQGRFSARDYSQEETDDSQTRKNYQETLITKPQQLTDYLLWQLRFLELTEDQKKIADLIIGNLDDDGFLRLSIEEIARTSGFTNAQAVSALELVQQLEPPGIAAQNLQEALKIQINRKITELQNLEKNAAEPENKSNKTLVLAKKIIEEHLPLLEKRNIQGIIRVTNAGHEEIKKAITEIGRLEPRPGRTFQSEETLAVTPDAIVSFSDDTEDEKLKIEIPDERIPELRISHYYRKLLRSPQTDEKTRQFLKDKMQAATDFIRAMSLRKSTLRGITEEIVKAQTEFFEKGFAHLKPLRLKDIAGTLKVHESTVSRAIHGKYLYTPQGTIPYKSFFSTKLETTDGSEESQKSIMEKIKKIISLEDPKKPLSDQDVVTILNQEGIVIARRTVAKYRELLKIMPTHMRREK